MDELVKLGGIIVAVILAILTSVRTRGYDRGSYVERQKHLDSVLEDHTNKHDLHFKHASDDQDHFQDTEIHTSKREKDSLEKKLDDLQKSINYLTRIILQNGHDKKGD